MSAPSLSSLQSQVTELQKDAASYRKRIADLEAQNERQQKEIDYLLGKNPPTQSEAAGFYKS
jgi:peptidoglycan hydrolase CwlO-like protein